MSPDERLAALLEREDDLTPEEEEALRALDADPEAQAALAGAERGDPVAVMLRAAPAPPVDLAERALLRALERRAQEEAAPPWARLAAGRPLVVRLRPLGLALSLAAAAALVLWLRSEPPAPPRPTLEREVAVRLVLPAEGARSVAVAGEFNGWSTVDHLLEDPEGDGVFVGLVRLPPGSYAYMFVVDGERWVTDPYAVTRRDDGFGNQNAILRID